ncbi:zf-DHHC-domain-containing protein [Ramaria rubella]|nr:zf-DHHC-domain-containing protein [Ramaria rubella]
MTFCSRAVFRCFKCLERAADRITGAAGPFFVAIAYTLLTIGAVTFFEVIAPTLYFRIITIPICILFATNMFAHYYYVCTVAPGFANDPATTLEGNSWLWARKRRPRSALQWSNELNLSAPKYTKCKRCGEHRPERSHHCRICKRCVLKYDHHCPVRINQCVGIHNERYFVLFMVYLVVCTFCFSILGWPALWESFEYFDDWPHRVPTWTFLLCYILSVVICLAVAVMCSWHLWSVAKGETTVENHDFEAYRKLAQSRDDTFVNSFDLGPRRNLELFFNVGPTGYPLYALLLPFRTAPYTDGRSWVKRDGFDRHKGINDGDEYTDEE